MEGTNTADEKTGKWRFYHDNGQMAADTSFIKNKPEGVWRFFSREGKLMKDGAYKGGKETGLWNFYEGSGRKIMELALLGGMVSGGGNRLYENGALIGEGDLLGIPKAVFDVIRDGKAAGTMEATDPPADDAKNKTSFRWSGKWLSLKKNGKWTEYFPGTRTAKIEGTYMMDKLNGPFKEYYQNGKLKAEGEYMTGKKNGEWKFYLPNGTLDTGNSGRYMLDKKSKF
jgi:antitoxin component YwqK of YwqJK toxin-antitoxin module